MKSLTQIYKDEDPFPEALPRNPQITLKPGLNSPIFPCCSYEESPKSLQKIGVKSILVQKKLQFITF